MSKPRLFLTISLILNAILLAWAAAPLSSSGAKPTAPTAGAEPATGGFAAWFEKLGVSRDPAPKPAEPAAAADYPEAGWRQSLYDDVAELRERGFDDATVRALALAEAERLFRERARAVMAPPRLEYWQAESWSRLRVEPGRLAIFQRLRREKLAAIEELVGPDALSTEANTPDTFMVGPRLGGREYLPRDKWLALTEYMETADAEQMAGAGPPLDFILRGRGMGQAERVSAQNAQIQLILGPQLFEEYVRRSSSAARRLRSELAVFKPTRAEFDALAAIEHEHQLRRFEMRGFGSNVSRGKMEAMSSQYGETIRAALGDQRYAEYERSRDHAFMQLDRLARELQLAPDAARASYELVEQSRTRMQTLAQRRDPRDPNLQREVQALQKELRDGVVENLGLQDLSESQLRVLLQGVADLAWYPPQGAAMVRGN